MAGELALSSSGRLTVTSVDVGITSVVPGSAATSLGKAEDAAHSSGDVGVMSLAVRKAIAADLSAGNTDGDYEPLQVDANGRLWVNAAPASPGATDLTKLEDAVHSSGDAGVMALGVIKATPTALGADGDYSPFIVDALNRLWTHEVGHRDIFKVAPTVDTAAYGAGDIAGGIQTIANWALTSGGSAILESVTVYDADGEGAALELLFFDATPSGGTYADQGAPTWHANDAAKCIGRVAIATGDYTAAIGGDKIACVKNIMLPLKVAATSLFMLIITVGTPTYTAGTDLHIHLGARY